MIHSEHAFAFLCLLWTFFHQFWLQFKIIGWIIRHHSRMYQRIDTYLIISCVQMCQQLTIDEFFCIVNDQHHNCFGHHVACSFCHNTHIRIHQISNRLHLPFEHRIQWTGLTFSLFLLLDNWQTNRKTKMKWNKVSIQYQMTTRTHTWIYNSIKRPLKPQSKNQIRYQTAKSYQNETVQWVCVCVFV